MEGNELPFPRGHPTRSKPSAVAGGAELPMARREAVDLRLSSSPPPPPPPSSRRRCRRCVPARRPGVPAAGAEAAVRKPRKSQVCETNHARLYYGHRSEFHEVGADDFFGCECIIAELPSQPRLMSLVDLQIWIIKLFRLHPETQDLSIKGFVTEESFPFPSDWRIYDFLSDKSWHSFVRKVKVRDEEKKFILYVDSSEIKHYGSLLKVVPDGYSQLTTVVLPEQENLACYSLSNHISHCLAEDLAMTTAQIVAHVARNYGKQLSHAGAWRAKQKALEMRFGTFYESHNNAGRLLNDTICKNPFSFVDLKDTEVEGCKDFRVLHRIFWAFAQCTQAFVYCRPVICVKGMPLCGKYHGVLLTALAFDANGYPIPVAFAVIEGESKESWLWFLRNVKRAVVKERSHVCVIHDCKRELLDAIEDLQNNPQETHPWRDVQSRWCIQHLAENFFSHFRDRELMMLFKSLCQQNQQNKFVEIWKELDELTLKFAVDKEGGAGREMQQESAEPCETVFLAQSPCNQLNSEENNRTSGSKSQLAMFSDWISPKPMKKWSLLHDTNGARYGIMETDINKCNHVLKLKGIECLPLTGLLKVTFERMTEYFHNRSAAANKAMGNPSVTFPECVQDEMNAKTQKAQTYHVIRMNSEDTNVFCKVEIQGFKVQSGQKDVIVHLASKYFLNKKNSGYQSKIRRIARCSCNKVNLFHKPCSHVIAVCCEVGVSPDSYMARYYSLSYLANTWSGKLDSKDYFPLNVQNYKYFSWGKRQTWIPDKRLERGLPAFLTSDRIQDEENMDEGDQQCRTKVITTEDSQETNKCSGETSGA